MKLFHALIISTVIISSGCNSLGVVRIRSESAYIRTPVGTSVQLEGTIQRFEDTDDTAMLLMKTGDKMPLGGRKVISLIHGEYVRITGIMKAKSMQIMDKNGRYTGGMSLTLKYIDVSGYITLNK